jgi:hypothetical protein
MDDTEADSAERTLVSTATAAPVALAAVALLLVLELPKTEEGGVEGTRLRREETVAPRAEAVEAEMPSSSLLALMDPMSESVVSRAAALRLAALAGMSLATSVAC